VPGEGGEGWGVGAPGHEQDAFRFLEKRFGDGAPHGPGRPFQFRVFGPGTVLNRQPFGLPDMPNGVSVSIQKQNNGPAQITVKRGDEAWNVVGDDPGSLEQLPEDLRPFVEQLLAGGGPMQIPLPAMPNMTMPNMPGVPNAFNDDELQQRLQKMEQHLEQLQLQLEQQFDKVHGDDQTE